MLGLSRRKSRDLHFLPGHPGVIGWGSSGDNFVSLRLIPWHGNGGIHLYWKANGQFVELAVQADGVISSGWKSIAASWDKSTIKIYMNGKLMGSKGYSGAFNAVDKSGFCACVGEPGRTHEAFQGKMRHVQVLNRALADSAVKDLPMAHATSGVKEASLTPPLVFSHVNKFQCGKLGAHLLFLIYFPRLVNIEP